LAQVNFVVQRAEDGDMAVLPVENEAIPYDLVEVTGQHFKKYTPEEVE
jgi:hypothetical protein